MQWIIISITSHIKIARFKISMLREKPEHEQIKLKDYIKTYCDYHCQYFWWTFLKNFFAQIMLLI